MATPACCRTPAIEFAPHVIRLPAVDGEAGEIPQPRPAPAGGTTDKEHPIAAANDHRCLEAAFHRSLRFRPRNLRLQS